MFVGPQRSGHRRPGHRLGRQRRHARRYEGRRGVSVGEIAAAHAAGALDLDDALRVALHRGRVIRTVIGRGKMAVVGASYDETQKILARLGDGLVSAAAENGPTSTVISGETTAVERLADLQDAEDVFCRILESVDYASHSPQMEPLQPVLRDALDGLTPGPAARTLVSTVTGEPIDGSAVDAGYWATNLRQPVLLDRAVDHLLATGHDTFVEISGHPMLVGAHAEKLDLRDQSGTVVGSLHRDRPGRAALLGELTALYCAGLPVDWARLYGAVPPVMPLPSYPWQRERCWVDQGDEVPPADRALWQAVESGDVDALHGLLGLAGTAQRAALATVLRCDRSSRRSAGSPCIRRRSRFAPTAPTWLENGQATDPEYWGAHLRSTVRFADNLGTLLADPDLILLEVGPGDSLTTFARRHHLWIEDRAAAGTLRRPGEKRADRQALLEGLDAIWAAGATLDWTGLCEADRRRRVRLPSYPFQRRRYWVEPDRPETSGPASPPASSSTYRPSWRRLQPVRPRAEAGPWLVLGADLPEGRALAESLPSVVRVQAGTGFAQDGPDAFTVDPADRDDYRRLLDALGDRLPARVVHLWSLAGEPGTDLDRADAVGFHSLLAFAQAPAGRAEHPVLTSEVLTRGVFSVTGDECLQPENATVIGPCTVVPQEVPGVTCRLLDVTGTGVESLADAVRSAPDEPVLARRGSHWWARSFDAVDLDPGPATGRLRDHGVYLITGGLGGIGMALAEHLARSVRAPAIGLLGRTPVPPGETWPLWLAEHDADDATSIRIRRIEELRRLGARVVVLHADVTDLAQTSRAVDELRARFGALSGVVHAAGLPASGLLAGKSRADTDAVLAAKTRGTLVLDSVCDRDPLDFFLLCSSRTAILGGPGQLDYCAANAFLDTFAAGRDGVTAVAWDTWRDTGMAADPAGGVDVGHPLLQRRLRATQGRADSAPGTGQLPAFDARAAGGSPRRTPCSPSPRSVSTSRCWSCSCRSPPARAGASGQPGGGRRRHPARGGAGRLGGHPDAGHALDVAAAAGRRMGATGRVPDSLRR